MMKIYPALKKTALPILAPCGFTLINGGPAPEHYFRNKDGTRLIFFSYDWKLLHRLRITFETRGGENMVGVTHHELSRTFCPSSRMTYTTQEELEEYVEAAARDGVNIILPYLDALEPNYIAPTEELRARMRTAPQERAARFAEKWSMKLWDKYALNRLNDILDTMRTDVNHRKEAFEKHEEEFLDLAAYFVGTDCIKKPDEPWEWREFPEGSGMFILPDGRDPLFRPLKAWNYGREVETARIRGRMTDEEKAEWRKRMDSVLEREAAEREERRIAREKRKLEQEREKAEEQAKKKKK